MQKVQKIKRDARLTVEFCGLPFVNPLVLLSGCVGFGE
ncbi:MAG: dihydroorotate dehydrogenase, partial [Proteobacteria bacterium]|nr:dihydroorotate dehydrogenase [Pseudomonadota bacterium]